MMEHLIALAFAPVGIWTCFFLSLRRTPYVVSWIIFCMVLTMGAVAETLGALGTSHVSFAGVLGIEMTMVAPAAVCALGTESVALPDEDGKEGAIAKYRKQHSKASNWYIDTHCLTNGRVQLSITDGVNRKPIASGDPVEDFSGFLDAKVKAEEAAATYNALRV